MNYVWAPGRRRLGAVGFVIAMIGLMSSMVACGEGAEAGRGLDEFSSEEIDDLAPATGVYTDESMPRVDQAGLDAVAPPFVQVGQDTGEDGLLYAAALGGYYMLRIQEPDGQFLYRYDPAIDEWTYERSLPRQAGPTYTLSYLFEVTRRDEFRFGAEWAHNYLNSQWPANDADLSYSFPIAHWIIGLVVHSRALGTTQWSERLGFNVDERLNAMGGFLLRNQLEDGSFTRRGYHPGAQFMQALWALYTHTGDEDYLDAVEKAGRYFYDNPDEHNYDLLLMVWGNEALMNLHAERPQEWILDFVWKLTDKQLPAQILPGADAPADYIGGFDAIPNYERLRPGALSMYVTEGAIDAYLLALRVGDVERAERYRAAALLGARFLLGLQFRKGDTDVFVESEMILGAVPFGPERPALRVDITRHLINTYLKVIVYLGLEEMPGEWAQPWENGDPFFLR